MSESSFNHTVFPFCDFQLYHIDIAPSLGQLQMPGRPSGAEVTDAAVFFDVGGLFFVAPWMQKTSGALSFERFLTNCRQIHDKLW